MKLFSKSWTDYLRVSTVNGVNLVHREVNLKSWLKIWTVVFIVLVLSALSLTIKALCLYLSYPVLTKVTSEISDKIPYPSITLCYTNLLKKSLVQMQPPLMSLLHMNFKGTMNRQKFLSKVSVLGIYQQTSNDQTSIDKILRSTFRN